MKEMVCCDFSVVRSFRGLGGVEHVLVLDGGMRYALFETPKNVGWFRSVERVPEGVRRRLERVGFGAWSMFNIGLRLVSRGWRLVSVRYYDGRCEEVEGNSIEYLTHCFNDSDMFFGIRSITLENTQNNVEAELDALTSLITICWYEEPKVNDVKDLMEAINEVLSKRP